MPLELRQITKRFPGVTALQDVDLTLHPGRIHALVGENGAGKSTLIQILSGLLTSDHGTITADGHPLHLADSRAARRAGIVTVHQEVDLFPDLSIAENLGLENGLPRHRLGWIDWPEQHRRTRAALAMVAEPLSPATPARLLSPAQRQMVEIAAAVSQAARVLILDEPTSSLSAAEAAVLFGHLRRFRDQGVALLYVSHRFEEIFALADEVTVLRDGRRVWHGAVGETSPPHLIARMVGRELAAVIDRPPGEPGPVRLRCDRLTAADGSFRGVTLEARGGEVLGLYGLVGAGRTEWAQGVFGLRPLADGTVSVDGRPVAPRHPGQMVRHGVAYVPEDRLRQGLCRGLSLRANLVLASLRRLAWAGVWLTHGREARPTREALARLSVRHRSMEQPIGTLSGGNQQKVVLGRWLRCEPGALILDEPTRGVDVGAKAEIYGLIRELAAAGRAVVLISSDLPEVLGQSDRVGVFQSGQLVATLDARRTTAEEVATAATPGATQTMAAAAEAGPAAGRTRLAAALNRLRGAALLVIVLALFGSLEFQTARFLRPEVLGPLATDAALLGLCALGVTLVLLAGGLDISLGAQMALSTAVAARLWEDGAPWPVVLGSALLVGAACGLLNASLSLLGRVSPIVVTLGTMSVYRGLTQWWLGGTVHIPDSKRGWLTEALFGLSPIAWLGLALLPAAWLVLRFTGPGRQVYALGSNPSAAHRVGISRPRVWLGVFAAQGALAGLAGLLSVAQNGTLETTSYEDTTLQAIAAAVVAGVALSGGRGSVWNVALSSLFLVALAPALVLLHVSATWQRTLVGAILVTAVLLDALWREKDA